MLANITNKASLKEPDYITAKPGEVRGQRSVSVQGIPTARKIEAALEDNDGGVASARLLATNEITPDESVKMNKANREQTLVGAVHNLGALSLDRIRLNMHAKQQISHMRARSELNIPGNMRGSKIPGGASHLSIQDKLNVTNQKPLEMPNLVQPRAHQV